MKMAEEVLTVDIDIGNRDTESIPTLEQENKDLRKRLSTLRDEISKCDSTITLLRKNIAKNSGNPSLLLSIVSLSRHQNQDQDDVHNADTDDGTEIFRQDTVSDLFVEECESFVEVNDGNILKGTISNTFAPDKHGTKKHQQIERDIESRQHSIQIYQSTPPQHKRGRPRRVSEIKGLLSLSAEETSLFANINDSDSELNLSRESSGAGGNCNHNEDESQNEDGDDSGLGTSMHEGSISTSNLKSTGRVDQDTVESEKRQLAYKSFLRKMRRSVCSDLVKSIRLFLVGVRLEHERLRKSGGSVSDHRVVDFFNTMENAIIAHAAWENASDDDIETAREGIEKYVMTRIVQYTFAVSNDERKQSEAISLRMRMLETFVTADHLGVPKACRNELVLELAQEELRKINQYPAPVDKIHCIVRACSIIFTVLGLSREGAGADDFFPAFLFVVLKARVKLLWCNTEYIRKYRNPSDLMSKAGYCFVNLRSAISFFQNVDPRALSMTEDEFASQLDEAKRKFSQPDGGS